MSDVIILVENFGKRYRIRRQAEAGGMWCCAMPVRGYADTNWWQHDQRVVTFQDELQDQILKEGGGCRRPMLKPDTTEQFESDF